MIFKKAGRSVLAAAAVVCLAAAALAQVPASRHVVLVVNENSSFGDVIANMPWLVGQGNANGYATNYQSDNGGSLLDYLWLALGSPAIRKPTALCRQARTISTAAVTIAFIEAPRRPIPSPTTTSSANSITREFPGRSTRSPTRQRAAAPTSPDNHNGTSYYRRHNGATWYSDIINNTKGSAGKIVDLSQLNKDLNNDSLPRFMVIVPDGNHDAHDCPVGMSSCTEAQKLAAADNFLSETLGPVLATPDFQAGGSGLAVVTFDECGGGTNAGCGASVYTALIGPKIKPHAVSATRYRHENALRTMLDALGIRHYPGAAATASNMSDFFATSTSKPDVTVSAPATGSMMISPVPLQASASASAGHSITGWKVYVDKVGVYNGGAVSDIAPKIAMKAGTHSVVVRAWDTSGNYGDQVLTVSVNTSKPAVNISTPSSNASLGSPFTLKAAAAPSSGQKITGWWVYVDKKATYKAGALSAIAPKLSLSTGTHKLVVRAWDTSGNYGDEALTVTVRKPSVIVKTPIGGKTVSSPIHLQASATPPVGRWITGWRVYLNGVCVFEAGANENIQSNLSAQAGTYTLLVRVWDSSGAYGDRTLNIRVP